MLPFTVIETVESIKLYFPIFFSDIEQQDLYTVAFDITFLKKHFLYNCREMHTPSFFAGLWVFSSFRFIGDGCPVVNVASLLCSLCWLWSAFAFAGVSEFLAASHECVF